MRTKPRFIYRTFSVTRGTVFFRGKSVFMLHVSAKIGVRLIAGYFCPTKYDNSNVLKIHA